MIRTIAHGVLHRSRCRDRARLRPTYPPPLAGEGRWGWRAEGPRSGESLRRELPRCQSSRYKKKMHDVAIHDAGPTLIREWIERAARLHPDKPYIVSVEDGRAIAFGEFARLVRRIGSFLERA